jgi:hypothetical protein
MFTTHKSIETPLPTFAEALFNKGGVLYYTYVDLEHFYYTCDGILSATPLQVDEGIFTPFSSHLLSNKLPQAQKRIDGTFCRLLMSS